MVKIVEIDRQLGKPEVRGALKGQVSVSLSHDARYCVGSAGEPEQGIDLEVITNRCEQDWQELLGPESAGLLAELTRQESLDRAGTRIWTLRECLYKALGVRQAAFSVFRRDQDRIVFHGRTQAGDECHVLTMPFMFTLGAERMLAVRVEPEIEEPGAPLAANDPDQALAAAGFDPASYRMDGDEQTRQFILRWPLAFKEAANLDRSVYFTHYPEWMGKVREIAMQPITEPLAEQMTTGRWGMVTNHSQVRILGEPRPGDVIEVRYWVQRAADQPEATVDLHFDWRRVDRAGHQERIALGEMRTTWVALIGHGQVRVEPLPDYFQAFIDARTPPDAERFRPQPLPETLRDADRGPLRYQRPPGPVRGPELARRVFETCLQESNLVGNIYFANYYLWQARLIDRFVQPLIPRVYRSAGASGELRCLRTRVDHLVDAMPFDDIEVIMTLEALYEGGATFGFDYFRVQDGHRQKLAHGEQECIWLPRQGAAELPVDFRKALEEKV